MIEQAREFELMLRKGQLLPPSRDGHDFEAEFVVSVRSGPGKPSNGSSSGRIRVGISGSLKEQWGVPDARLRACLVRLAVNYLAHRIRGGLLTPTEEIRLTTYNAPPHPPFDPLSEEENLGPYAILT